MARPMHLRGVHVMVPDICSSSPVVRTRLLVYSVRKGLPIALAATCAAALAQSAEGQQSAIPPILAGAHQTVPSLPAMTVVAVPTPIATPDKPLAAFSRSALTLRDSVVALVRAQLGRRYRHGGTSPEHGFDCSGLVKYVMGAFHIDLPRTARMQAKTGAPVPRDTTALQPGDLLTFGHGGVSHIGIYVGDGHFVQASSVAGRVVESRLNRPLVHKVKPWRGARRLFTPDDSTATPATDLTIDGAG
jgi:cell wall-associated NlpC family hydrolase